MSCGYCIKKWISSGIFKGTLGGIGPQAAPIWDFLSFNNRKFTFENNFQSDSIRL